VNRITLFGYALLRFWATRRCALGGMSLNLQPLPLAQPGEVNESQSVCREQAAK